MNKKTFIVEDDANLLYSLQAKLSLVGVEVETNSGNTGISELINDIKKAKPNFIILDLILPKKNGFEVLETIRQDPLLEKLPVIIISNLGQPSDIERGKALGVIDYFIKARLSVEELVNKVKKQTEAAKELKPGE